MFKNGEQALEDTGFIGMQVSIDYQSDDKVEFSD